MFCAHKTFQNCTNQFFAEAIRYFNNYPIWWLKACILLKTLETRPLQPCSLNHLGGMRATGCPVSEEQVWCFLRVQLQFFSFHGLLFQVRHHCKGLWWWYQRQSWQGSESFFRPVENCLLCFTDVWSEGLVVEAPFDWHLHEPCRNTISIGGTDRNSKVYPVIYKGQYVFPRPLMKKAKYLTRDWRMKEPKKVGQPGAGHLLFFVSADVTGGGKSNHLTSTSFGSGPQEDPIPQALSRAAFCAGSCWSSETCKHTHITHFAVMVLGLCLFFNRFT